MINPAEGGDFHLAKTGDFGVAVDTEVPQEALESWLRLVPSAEEAVDRSRYRVTYAVIANSSREGRDWLPFFSKLNLMQQGRQLSTMGFTVAIARVPIIDPE